MTPGIKDLIQHQAKQAGMTVTDYIITCALGKEIVRWTDWMRSSPK